MKKLIVLTLLFISVFVVNAQIYEYVAKYNDEIPDKFTNVYIEPNKSLINKVLSVLDQSIIGESISHSDLSYLLSVQIQEDGAEYWILNVGFHGLYVINPYSCRKNLIIQVPHPLSDEGTVDEGIVMFKETNAFIYMQAGTHRCNSSNRSQCDGMSSDCGSLGSYRISDVAHNTNTLFHKITERLDKTQDKIFLQLHQFGKKFRDPDIILSNGVESIPIENYIGNIANRIPNKYNYRLFHSENRWKKLTAITNVQGRLINGVSNQCSEYSTLNTGRFIHIQQSKSVVNDPYFLINIIKEIIPCTAVEIMTVDNFIGNYFNLIPNVNPDTLIIPYEWYLYNSDSTEVKRGNGTTIGPVKDGVYILKVDNQFYRIVIINDR